MQGLQRAQHDLGADFEWTLLALTTSGLSYLGGFLRGIKRIWDRQQNGTTWGPRVMS